MGPRVAHSREGGREFVADESELRNWLKTLLDGGFSVAAPVEREAGFLAFEEVSSADAVVIDSKRTISSPKLFFHLPQEELAAAPGSSPGKGSIIFGIHGCDMNGLRVLADTLASRYVDPFFKNRIERTAIVCVTCCDPDQNCFCTSMGTGPSVSDGYDLLITKIDGKYLVEIGTERGRSILKTANLERAEQNSSTRKEELLESLRLKMPKQFRTLGVPQLLLDNMESEVWKKFAEKCLGCTNCTMVCPTCYCYDVRDWADLYLKETGRKRVWDSCQSYMFASVHGGNFRPLQTARLRQFVCHKLSYWIDQYGRFGCVGCGRCMSWCPTGIDLTDIANEIRKTQE
jgi:heterodisulfide reductase subunit C